MVTHLTVHPVCWRMFCLLVSTQVIATIPHNTLNNLSIDALLFHVD